MIESLLTLAASLLSCAVTYGVMKAKVDRMVIDLNDLEQRMHRIREQLVTREEFALVVSQMRSDSLEIRADIRRILEILSTR